MKAPPRFFIRKIHMLRRFSHITQRALSSEAKPATIINQILHGRPSQEPAGTEHREFHDEERSTHSKRLARGKYVHEICSTFTH
jgi:hypothetical protein